MIQHLRNREAFAGFENDHFSDKVLKIAGHVILSELKGSLENQLVQIRYIGGFKWHCPLNHGVEKYPERPHIRGEAIISAIYDDFRGQVGRRTALFLDHSALLHEPRNSKVAKLDTTFSVHEHIVQFDVSV